MADFTPFDRRGYPGVPVEEGYRDWLATYESTVEDLMDYALLERVRGVLWHGIEAAADLGCGTGRTGVWLAERGVGAVDGVDLTAEMLGRAGERKAYRRLVHSDLASSDLAGEGYSLVTCCLVDEHLRELAPLYREATRLLGPDGYFLLVCYHPFFMMATGMPTHFDHPDGYPVTIETHLHLISDHVAAGRSAGLSLIELHEGQIDAAWIEAKPKWRDRRGWPISYCMVWARETR